MFLLASPGSTPISRHLHIIASAVVIGFAAQPASAWANENEATLPDACDTRWLDDSRIEVRCGISTVPEIDVDVESTFKPADPDPFTSVDIAFQQVGDAQIIDLATLETRTTAPYFQCFGKTPGDTRTEKELVLSRVEQDVRLMAIGEAPRCYEIGGISTEVRVSVAETLDVEFPDEPPVIESSKRTVTVTKPRKAQAPVVEVADKPTLLATLLSESTVGADLRAEFTHRKRCPVELADVTAFAIFQSLATQDDYVVDVMSLVGSRTALMCTYDPQTDSWLAAEFHCADGTTCYSQLHPEFPRTCQPFVRESEIDVTWAVRDHCFAFGNQPDRALELRHISLELGVYLSLIDMGDGSTRYALIFPYSGNGSGT